MKPAAFRSHSRFHFRSRARGLSLIELMISLVIGLVVVGAVIVSVIGAGNAGRFQAAFAQMNEDAQIALSILRRDLEMSGYSQPTALTSSGGASPTLSLTFGSLGTQTFVFGCDSGFSNPRAATLVCGTATTPAVEAVYEADKSNTVLTAANVPTDCLGNGIQVGPPYLARNRFFISTSASGRPELSCASNHTVATAQPLVENIESMKIWYGLAVAASPAQVVRYVTATQMAVVGATEWNRVISVRVCLIVKSSEPVLIAGEDDRATVSQLNRYLDCDAVTQTSTDRYLRRAFFTTAAVRDKMP